MAAMEDTATSSEIVESARGLRLFVRHWEVPQGVQRRALVLMVHGFSWHSLYFGAWASTAAAQGIEVASFDLQGHGRSDALGGKRGYAPRMADFCDDVALVLQKARERCPQGLPAFLAGESMGGAIALRLLQLRPELQGQLAGLVLLSPVVRVSPDVLPPRPVMWVLRLLARFFPTMPVPDDSIAKGFEEAFGDAEFAAKAKKDPLVVLEAPRIGMGVEIIDGCAAIAAGMEGFNLPLLVLQADQDTRTDPANALELGRRASSADKTAELVHAKHQLLQDKPEVSAGVMRRINEWVLARTGG